MEKLIDLDNTYREHTKEYLDFFTNMQKILGTPTDSRELRKAFDYLLTYLESTVDCFEILSTVKPMDPMEMEHLKQSVVSRLQEISNELQKY